MSAWFEMTLTTAEVFRARSQNSFVNLELLRIYDTQYLPTRLGVTLNSSASRQFKFDQEKTGGCLLE